MPSDFFPSRDSELVTWTQGFSEQINADPAGFGLSVEQAQQYQELSDQFVEALTIATQPGTRTPVAIRGKDVARSAMIAHLRAVVRIIQAAPTTTDAQRVALDLPVRQPRVRRAPVPIEKPDVAIVAIDGRTVRVRLMDRPTYNRARPVDASGASVFYFVGDQYPADFSQWVFACNTTQTVVDVDFPATLPPGTSVWITARWYNTRAAFGANANPLQAHLGYGLGKLAA